MTETLSIPEIRCYREYPTAPALIPGRSERDWMDGTSQRFAYRCTPLSIANASGWELVLPFSFAAGWTGGPLTSDVTIVPAGGDPRASIVVASIFGHGVLSFHPGYLFQTSPGWALNVRGAPNVIKDGITPLEGLVETDWLPFTFTMNWRFTRPGLVMFEKGESFCFITPTPHAILDEIQPQICSLDDNPTLKADYQAWRQSRYDFQARIDKGDPETVKQGWQRNYVQGRDASDKPTTSFHLSKRKLKTPK
jgi:hypothetical protein